MKNLLLQGIQNSFLTNNIRVSIIVRYDFRGDIMRVDISKIENQKGGILEFSFLETISEKGGTLNVVSFLKPVICKGSITNMGRRFSVEGLVQTSVAVACDRCLCPVEVTINCKLEENYAKPGENDEEVENFSGETIDLLPAVLKVISLSLPMKVVCSDDCKGLCPVCGKDLNDGACGCDTSYIDPRFESLRTLFHLDQSDSEKN